MTPRISAESFEKTCPRRFFRLTVTGYVPGFEGLVVELTYFPGDDSRVVRRLPSIITLASLRPGSASIVNVIPVLTLTSRLGETDIL